MHFKTSSVNKASPHFIQLFFHLTLGRHSSAFIQEDTETESFCFFFHLLSPNRDKFHCPQHALITLQLYIRTVIIIRSHSSGLQLISCKSQGHNLTCKFSSSSTHASFLLKNLQLTAAGCWVRGIHTWGGTVLEGAWLMCLIRHSKSCW